MSSVKYFHSAMTGAPTLNGTAGTLDAVLEACLVTGFGLARVDGILVSNGIATATAGMGHSFEPDCVAALADSSEPGLNGEFTITSTTGNTFSFDATGVPDGAYTGASSAKLAPVGWEKVFTSSNVSVYRTPELSATRCFLRLDDSGTTFARAVGYEWMSDTNTGTGPFPTSAQVSGGYYWPKSTTANSSPTYWVLVGDVKGFWIYNSTSTTVAAQGVSGWLSGFGDLASRKAGDAYGCVLYGAASSGASSTPSFSNGLPYASIHSGPVDVGHIARSFTAVGGSRPVFNTSESFGAGHYSGAGSITYPNGPDNGLLLSRMLAFETTPRHLRGTVRGLLFNPQMLGSASFVTRDKLVGQGALAGRTLLALKGSAPAQTSETNITTFIDITGPWE